MKRFSFIVIIIGLVCILSAPAYSATLCVNPGGTPPCYGSIQAAITAANPGDTIQVWVGTYFESNIIVNKDDLTIEGVMVTFSRIKGVGTIIVSANPKNVIVDVFPNILGFYITGNRVTIKNLTVRFAFETNISSSAHNTTLNNVRVLGSGSWNIFADGNNFTLINSLVAGAYNSYAIEIVGHNTSIIGNRILNNYHGVYNTGANAKVQNNDITGTVAGDCLYMYYGNNNLVTDNTIANCDGGGINSYQTINALIARNKLMNTGAIGIYLYDPRTSRIEYNTVTNTVLYGIYSESNYTNPADGNTFTYNTANNVRDYGYFIQENNPTITHNTARYINSIRGFYVACYTTCTGGTISNNYSAYSRYGYELSVNNMYIEGNTAEYSNNYGFYLYGNNNDFMNNIARYNKTELGAPCAGFYIDGGGNNVNGNLAEMNNSNGVLVNSISGVNIVNDNIVRDNFRNGLVLDNAGGSSDVTNNIVTNNEGEGIANHSGTVNTMTGNTATGNRVGVDICNDGTITIFTGNTHTSGGSGTPCSGL